jgi:hypothetical protein
VVLGLVLGLGTSGDDGAERRQKSNGQMSIHESPRVFGEVRTNA